MDACKLTHAERINEWEKQIRLCRSSGMTVILSSILSPPRGLGGLMPLLYLLCHWRSR